MTVYISFRFVGVNKFKLVKVNAQIDRNSCGFVIHGGIKKISPRVHWRKHTLIFDHLVQFVEQLGFMYTKSLVSNRFGSVALIFDRYIGVRFKMRTKDLCITPATTVIYRYTHFDKLSTKNPNYTLSVYFQNSDAVQIRTQWTSLSNENASWEKKNREENPKVY